MVAAQYPANRKGSPSYRLTTAALSLGLNLFLAVSPAFSRASGEIIVFDDDGGRTWISGNVFIDVPSRFRHRPYVKYTSNGADTVHMFYTDGHPRNFDNSTYHIFYKGGNL